MDPKADKLLTIEGESSYGLGLLWIAMFFVLWVVHKAVSANSQVIHRSILATKQMYTVALAKSNAGGKKLRSV